MGRLRAFTFLFRVSIFLVPWLTLCWFSNSARAYSLLTHEQIIDTCWKNELTPALLRRFPGVREEELKKAHAYAYGGCLMPDMGYYPPGNRFFTDLTHYVRSGEFVANLINEATNVNELAFALGALAHFCADNTGHPFINRSVAITFPKLRKKYGDEITYAENPKAHIRVEFGFDVSQIEKSRYTPQQYHDFIGFEVAKPVLEQAFLKTYGLRLGEIVKPVDLSIGTFRHAASKFIPDLTRAALEVDRFYLPKKDEEAKPKLERYHLSRSEYQKDWGRDYRNPSLLSRFLAFVLKFAPKVGPLKALAFKKPSPEVEELCIHSVNETLTAYRNILRRIGTDRVTLANMDCDTGRATGPGEYELSDQAYMELLHRLTKHGVENISPELRQNILGYFAQPQKVNLLTSRERRAWRRALVELEALKDDRMARNPDSKSQPPKRPNEKARKG